MIRNFCDRRPVSLVGRLALVSLVLLSVSACGQPKGKVTGQVLLDGKPLPGGIVMFRPVKTSLNPVTAQLDENGNYEATVPAGECKIGVDNRGLLSTATGPVGVGGDVRTVGGRGGKAGAVAPPPGIMEQAKREQGVPDIAKTTNVGKYVAIPQKYYDPEQSGLTLTVKTGSQPHDIQLSSK